MAADKRAIETLGASLTGSDRALVVAFPTMALRPGRLATEEDTPDPKSPGGGRIPSEEAALALDSKGVRSSVVRLAPVVHDREKQGLAPMMADITKKKGVSAYVGEGRRGAQPLFWSTSARCGSSSSDWRWSRGP